MKPTIMDTFAASVAWYRTLYARCAPEFMLEIVRWADRHGCSVECGDEFFSLYGGYFIGIVDRTVVGREHWEDYLGYLDKTVGSWTVEKFPELTVEELNNLNSVSPLIILDPDSEFGIDRPDKSEFYYCRYDNPEQVLRIMDEQFKQVTMPAMLKEINEMESSLFKDLKWLIRMIAQAAACSVRTEWKKGARVPLLTHETCRDKILRKRRETGMFEESAVIRKEIIDGQEFLEIDGSAGWLVISRDQTTSSATDLVKCRCSACGKRFKLNAGYIEALSLLSEQSKYLRSAV